MDMVLQEVREKKERRNCYLNLAYTGPHDNSSLQREVPYEKVANMAVDMFFDTSKAVSAPETKAAPAAEGDETTSKEKSSLLDNMAQLSKIPW